MKNIAKLFVVASLLSVATGCESFLDVNTNPNNPSLESLQPNFVLAQSLKVTGDLSYNTLNTYGSWVAGYWAQAGGVNGYGEERTYTYTAIYNQDFWRDTYDNLKDYDIIERDGPAAGYPYHAAIAKIMKVFDYQMLVDEYGDIPYTQALQGASVITPKYDKAEDIYKDFIVKLDEAITEIKAVPAATAKPGTEDIIFRGDMNNWVKFANTLKLRILIRQSFVPTLNDYVKSEIAKLQSSDGFITTDVLVQPGYLQTTGKQNPFWNRYRATPAADATARNYQAGTQYVIDQYKNNNDPRLAQLYVRANDGTYKGLIPGDQAPPLGGPAISRWKDYGGILKGFDAPSPIMLAAESYFLQAEAKSRGFLSGGDSGAGTDFNNGIRASFVYFYTPAPSAPADSRVLGQVDSDYQTYLAANTNNPMVNWSTASNRADKLDKIIYQKYLAMNSVTGGEAWSEYRRTTYPKFPASLESASSRADKLPVRLLYPQYEISTNPENIPSGVNQFTSKIFWDVLD
ncbi:SusD/RagB family nutrient-binding outer membrane lipoprotein [Hymenobacter aerilatus]|uniref:SusD/RagB family nutrient-binding outer membrane lipoprotein n=1 Tax=Hymenobacter aerilatus TaxID=2932251 RepID=A0A8T9SV97_9BACT|nr:SusD/RagB family nutrient-binding outer membrane lipoprotein [Hymenobacter aerilatus]UOR05687.1 SusD/RagB family nutrient-binding outer membrane lipoprotein [Hymenobacter aerilatus]